MRRTIQRLLAAVPAAVVVVAGCGDSPKTEIPKDLNKPVPKMNTAGEGTGRKAGGASAVD